MLDQKYIFLLTTSLLCTIIYAQNMDTVYTNYPGTDQSWEKVYSGTDKVSENI